MIKDKNAPACIKSASATEEGYEDAWKTVLKTYNNDRLLLQTVFESVMNIKSNDENPAEMQCLSTEIQSCADFVRRINGSKIPMYDGVLKLEGTIIVGFADDLVVATQSDSSQEAESTVISAVEKI